MIVDSFLHIITETSKEIMQPKDSIVLDDTWKGPNEFELTLTKEVFQSCVKILVNLPFTKTEEDTEPNMITIRKKDRISQHPYFQIMRETDIDELYWVVGVGHLTDPTKLVLPDKYYNGNFMIEMSCGSESVRISDNTK